MRKIKEVLRLRYEQSLSDSKIAQSVSMPKSTVGEYIKRAKRAGITWPVPEGMDETTLERLLFPRRERTEQKAKPDWIHVYQEYKHPDVTLMLLWLEYKENHPRGYQYTRFCQLYNEWVGKQTLVMRQEHKAGEKIFVDYCGSTVSVTDSATGEVKQAQVFVAVLGASNYTYAEASWSQGLFDWITAHVHAFEYFGGAPQIIVPDNLRSGISHASYYEPDINPNYLEMAHYYTTVIIPARVRKPKDKAKVEAGVQVVQRWILARLRHEVFFSVAQLNTRIKELLIWLNNHLFQKLEGSRQSFFTTLDKPALKPLPAKPYEYAEWKKARVHIDYHIEIDHHYYSVPYKYVSQQVDVRITATVIECFLRGERIASHIRSYEKGRHTTLTEHMPKAHQAYAEWTPQRLISWAANSGEHVRALVEKIFAQRLHPEQGFRASLGIMRLGKHYGNDRLDAACKRALGIGASSYKSIESILRKGLDRIELQKQQDAQDKPVEHINIRGSAYYQ